MFTISPFLSAFLYLLRIVAGQAVLIGHLIDRQAPYIQNQAVVVFSLLSGFFIAYSTNRKKKKSDYQFKDYFIDRFARVYSVLVPSLLFTALVDFAHLRLSPNTYNFVATLNLKTFVTNLLQLQYFPSVAFGSNKPLWTIALWWWLYMAYGWILLSSSLKQKKPLIHKIILGLFLIVPISNLFFARLTGVSLAWILGVLFFYLLNMGNFGVKESRSNLKTNRWLKFFAEYSFTLYLIHYPLAQLLKDWQPFVVFILCNLVAMALAQVTEKRYKLLGEFTKRRFVLKYGHD
jgi:peptidoglycan/LPS O-acetylase OafA/YrhL